MPVTQTSRIQAEFVTSAVYYLLAAGLAFTIFVVGYGPRRFFSGSPLALGDSLNFITIARAIIDQGWYWNIERLSAPFSMPMVMFPVAGTLDNLLLKCLSFFTQDPVFLVTLFFGLTFPLSAVSASYVLHDLGLERRVAVAFGLIFAFTPFVFYRSTIHLALVTYLIPFAIGASVHILRGTFSLLNSRRIWVYYAAAAGLGLNFIYTTFFSCFFVTLSLLLCLLSPSRHKSLRRGVIFLVIMLGTAAVANLPAARASVEDPQASERLHGFKIAAEAEVYGLKIRQMLIPTNKVPFVDRISERLSNNNFPLENENRTARLGVIGSMGFLALILFALCRLSFRLNNFRILWRTQSAP
jgi:phosphoglycerol transferase